MADHTNPQSPVREVEDVGNPDEPMVLCDVPKDFTIVETGEFHVHFGAGQRNVPQRFLQMGTDQAMHPALAQMGVTIVEAKKD